MVKYGNLHENKRRGIGMIKGNSKSFGREGFTLVEVLIVIIIIGVLAGLAIPMYRSTAERSKKAEALYVLSAMRQSEGRFFATGGAYTDNTNQLDYAFTNAALTAGNQVVRFTYTIATDATEGFIATAKRNGVDGGDGSSTVTLNAAGARGGTGIYS